MNARVQQPLANDQHAASYYAASSHPRADAGRRDQSEITLLFMVHGSWFVVRGSWFVECHGLCRSTHLRCGPTMRLISPLQLAPKRAYS